MVRQQPTARQRFALVAYKAYKGAGRWAVRIGSFYAGYRILHHEVYETETAEILLVILGLWLCGIAPASFIDSLRRAATEAQGMMDDAASKLESADKDAQQLDPSPDGNGA